MFEIRPKPTLLEPLTGSGMGGDDFGPAGIGGLLATLALPVVLAGQPPPALERASRAAVGPVEAEMRNIRYHAGSGALEIHYLRGQVRPTDAGRPPWFEDRTSFTIAVDTAEIAIQASSLEALLNEHVF